MKPVIALFATLLISSSANAQETPNPFPTVPSPATPRTVSVPEPLVSKLSNGIRLIVVSRPGSGLVSLRLLAPFGSIQESPEKNGSVNAMAELLTKGTRTRSATKIADSIEQLGASLGSSAGYDSVSVSLSVLKSRLDDALPIFADVVQNPIFPPAELNRYRAQTLDELAVAYRSPGTLARLVSTRTLYGSFPYGNPVVGTVDTLPKITQADLVQYHKQFFQPQYLTLIVTGDVTGSDAQAMAEKALGNWNPPSTPVALVHNAPKASGTHQIIVIDRPDAGQSAVVVSRLGISQSESNPVVPVLTNDILGGGFSSRLNREVRIKRGLSYGASSRLDPREFDGPLSLVSQSKNETAGEAARVMVDELAKLGEQPASADEFAARKSALSGDFARSLETGGGLGFLVGSLALYNRPLSELQTYLDRVQAVTPDEVQKFASTRFAAGDANIVIVGNAAKFLPDLKARFPDQTVKVIPFAQLDLTRPDLMKVTK